MTDLATAIRASGVTIERLLDPACRLGESERRVLGIVDDDIAYLHAFRAGFNLGEEFFPRVAPRGDYLMGWNHGREVRSMTAMLAQARSVVGKTARM